MKLKKLIGSINEAKPSSFSESRLTEFINEVEGTVFTEIHRRNLCDYIPLVWSWEGDCVIDFLSDSEIRISGKCEFGPGGDVTISALEGALSVYNGEYHILELSHGTEYVLKFSEGSFSIPDDAETSTHAHVKYDGSGCELSVAPPHDKMYFSYLWSIIDFFNAEYGEYANSLVKYNNELAEYMRYWARDVRPSNGNAEKSGYYLSAYSLAVKHGFVGSEEEWVRMTESRAERAESAAERAESAAERAESAAERAESAAERAESAENYAASAETSAKIAQSAQESAKDSVTNARTAQAIAQSAQESAKAFQENARTAQAIAQSASASAKAFQENARTAQAIAQSAQESAKQYAESAASCAERAESAVEEAAAEIAALKADLNDTVANAKEDINKVAADNAAKVEEIYNKMQITFFYDEEGYVCYDDKVST